MKTSKKTRNPLISLIVGLVNGIIVGLVVDLITVFFGYNKDYENSPFGLIAGMSIFLMSVILAKTTNNRRMLLNIGMGIGFALVARLAVHHYFFLSFGLSLAAISMIVYCFNRARTELEQYNK